MHPMVMIGTTVGDLTKTVLRLYMKLFALVVVSTYQYILETRIR